jgi:hypothetical protein
MAAGKKEIEKQKQKNEHVAAEKTIQKKPNKHRKKKNTMDGNFEKLTTTEERRRPLVETRSLRPVAPNKRK